MKTFRPGFELYSARSLLAADFAGTLEAIAAIGYREVEGSDLFGRSPEEVRALFDRLGLSAPAWHTFLDLEDAKAVENATRLCQALGAGFMVIPAARELISAGPAGVVLRDDLDASTWRRVAAALDRVGAQLATEGIRLAYHNHHVELVEVEPGRSALDLLLEETTAAHVGFELDLCWTVAGGGDPIALFEAHPGRFPLCHAKDTDEEGRDLDIGLGSIDFDAILDAADGAGIEHVFVERDEEEDPMRTARRGHAALTRWWDC